jgi:putative hemolysin
MNPFWMLVFAALAIVGSAYFAGLETGLISLNRIRLRHLVEKGNRRAQILHSFLQNPERLLATTLLGTNFSNVLVAVLAASAARHLVPHRGVAEAIATVVSATLLLIFGEIVPKSLFRQYSHRMCMAAAPSLFWIGKMLAVPVAVLNFITRGLQKSFRMPESGQSPFITRDELKALAHEGETGGELTPEERQMIHSVFDLRAKTVADVMVPMTKTRAVTPQTVGKEIAELSVQSGFSRFPVLDDGKAVGIVNIFQLLFDTFEQSAAKTAAELMQKPQIIAATEPVDRALPRLRASRTPLAIVADAHGNHIGIVTIEDLVEEIVGDVEG